MKVITVSNYEEISKTAADIMAKQIILKNNSILGLATGGTPLGMYKELIKMYSENKIDFSEVKTFNLDEYYGLDIKNKNSYHYYMMNNFFNHVNIKKENINIPNGNALHMEEECTDYDNKIKNAGGIDIQVLGIGVDGHIGFNEPDSHFETGTHIVKLKEETIKSNSRFFNSEKEVPHYAISMGIKNIMQSKSIILLANGEEKAEAISKTVNGKLCPEVPASILQIHPNVTIIVDSKAAGKL